MHAKHEEKQTQKKDGDSDMDIRCSELICISGWTALLTETSRKREQRRGQLPEPTMERAKRGGSEGEGENLSDRDTPSVRCT